MKVIVPLVFAYDVKQWAHERGIAETDACTDFAALLRRAVNDGTIAAALDAVLPVLRGHITAHPVDGLDPTTRDDLLRRLREARDADQDQALLADIREHLAAHRRDLGRRRPRWVIFHTREWDNGHFLTGSDATVYFANGDTAPVDFHAWRVEDLLTDMYGARGPMAALGVDLRAGTLAFDDYADNVPDLLGIPASKHPRR